MSSTCDVGAPACSRVAASRNPDVNGTACRHVRDFKRAWEAKDIDALIGLLDPNVVALSDGGGVVNSMRLPVDGSEQVARTLVDIVTGTPDLTILERAVKGQPGLVIQQDGVTGTVMAFDVGGDRIKHIWSVRNPEKLRPWTNA